MSYARVYKELIVKELQDIVEQGRNIIVVSYQGLTNNEIERLRRALRTLNLSARLLVIKKGMTNIALKRQTRTGITGLLEGLKPAKTLALTVGDDTVGLCRTLSDFIRTHSGFCMEKGFVEGRCVGAEELVKISRLPAKEVLQYQVTAAVKMPIVGLVNSLSGIYRKLVYVLMAVKNQEDKHGSRD